MPGHDAPGVTAQGYRLRLGHIAYSNCFPVHARFFDRPAGGDPALIEGIPSRLNQMLSRREIDLAPCSSIEYARHANSYRILPDLVIGSRGAVQSIVLASDRPASELGGRVIGLPTASATSVLLLKILLRIRWGVEVEFRWFDQQAERPFERGMPAALFIGDIALRTERYEDRPFRFDLGTEWWEETGLPFAFAVWQVASGSPGDVRALHQKLLDSRKFGLTQRRVLAERYSSHFGIPSASLDTYWSGLQYELDRKMREGLEAFYRLAVEIGELASAPPLRWID